MNTSVISLPGAHGFVRILHLYTDLKLPGMSCVEPTYLSPTLITDHSWALSRPAHILNSVGSRELFT